MVTLQSVQGHTGLTHPSKFFDIRVLWHLVLSARVPKCQKIKKGGLDQCGAEHFGRLIFPTVRKKYGLKGLESFHTKACTVDLVMRSQQYWNVLVLCLQWGRLGQTHRVCTDCGCLSNDTFSFRPTVSCSRIHWPTSRSSSCPLTPSFGEICTQFPTLPNTFGRIFPA